MPTLLTKSLLVALFVTASPAADTMAGPPPADTAAGAALQNSPRHGEWMEITFQPPAPTPAAGSAPESSPAPAPVKIKTWVVYPERAEKAPVVIVIHEIFGLTDWVRAVADDLASHGFIAVAPDLLSGMGPEGGGTDSFRGDGAREAIRKLTPADTAARLNAVRAAALALPSATDASACIGFCWGGSASFTFAAATPESAGKALPPLRGAVACYGTAPTDQAILEKITCPVLGLYGGDDARVTSTVEATTAAMKMLGKSFASHTYPGAGHGFIRQQSGRDGANLAAAEQGWKAAIEFLKACTALPSSAPPPPAPPVTAPTPSVPPKRAPDS